jgi:alkanesulfonate monooxygenase SsuD/methylene tetrahydromethanopterin reductase-like flavin-dependent oxidoreductase (luciferase family)
MRFGIFYEHQIPRPWGPGDEKRLIDEALEQIEVAERAGFHCVWEVEHHFLEEYSHSSAPEVFLAAASQRTSRIRLGHGIVQIPPPYNHPVRVAERAAMLDLVSGGRVELGTGEGSSAAELGGFGVDRTTKHEMWEDALDAIAHMFVEEPFAGWDSAWMHMPPRNVVPKPVQKPHPPLWVACSRRQTIHAAARKGIGALAFSFIEPEAAGAWVEDYYRILASDECVPAGFAVNASVALTLPMMCHQDESTAIERGIDGAHFFGYSLAHYYGMGRHAPGVTNIWNEFQQRRDQVGFARSVVRAEDAPLGIQLLQHGIGSLRGAIGTPRQIIELAERYEAVGVDQLIFAMQVGRNRHEHICESLELFGREVLPRFAERCARKDADKAARLGPAIERALGRRQPARTIPPYYIDEQAELERARQRRAGFSLAEVLARARAEAGHEVRRRGRDALASLVRGQSDRVLEKRFGSALVQRLIFGAMARAFVPRLAFGFQGDIVYELATPATGNGASAGHASVNAWTLHVEKDRATARPGASPSPALRIRMSVSDFARLMAGDVPRNEPLLQGRIEVEGDFGLAARASEMFGGPSSF